MLWGSGPKSLHQNPTTGRPNRLFKPKPDNLGRKTIIPDFGCPFRSGLNPKSPVDLHGLLRGAVLGLPCLNSSHPANLCLSPQGGGHSVSDTGALLQASPLSSVTQPQPQSAPLSRFS